MQTKAKQLSWLMALLCAGLAQAGEPSDLDSAHMAWAKSLNSRYEQHQAGTLESIHSVDAANSRIGAQLDSARADMDHRFFGKAYGTDGRVIGKSEDIDRKIAASNKELSFLSGKQGPAPKVYSPEPLRHETVLDGSQIPKELEFGTKNKASP